MSPGFFFDDSTAMASGETLVESPAVAQIINDVDGLNKALRSIQYPIPAAAERVPWLEKLDVTAEKGVPSTLNPEADVERENAFLEITLKAVRVGLQKMRYLGEPYVRPDDFLAEMIKTDRQMKLVEQRLDLQTVRIEKVEKRKDQAKQRAVAKGSKAKMLAARRKSRQHFVPVV